MRSTGPTTLMVVLALVACGGHEPRAHNDAAVTAIDAAVDAPVDAAIDGAGPPVDAGPDAASGGYVRQPPVTIPPEAPALDLSHQPVDGQGRPILGEAGSYVLVPRPADALTALSTCTAMIVRCVDPATQGRSLDACVISPRRCTTAQPWQEAACCAGACVDRYEQLRGAGTPPITAFRQTFYGTPSCAPGVDALVGGAP